MATVLLKMDKAISPERRFETANVNADGCYFLPQPLPQRQCG
jgi:hypothetical protein